MTFLTSYSTRSIGRRGLSGSTAWILRHHVEPCVQNGGDRWRPASRRAADVDRHGKADADKDVSGRWGYQPGHDADHLPVAVEQRAAGVARVDRGIDLDQAFQICAVIGRLERAVEAGDHARAHRCDRPKGLPTHYLIAHLHGARVAQGGRHEQLRRRLAAAARRYHFRAASATAAGSTVPSAKVSWILEAPSTTCRR